MRGVFHERAARRHGRHRRPGPSSGAVEERELHEAYHAAEREEEWLRRKGRPTISPAHHHDHYPHPCYSRHCYEEVKDGTLSQCTNECEDHT